MKAVTFLAKPILIAFLAALLQVIDQSIMGNIGYFQGYNGFAWIAFQAWALYFLGGCTIKGARNTFISYVVGIIASIAIIKFAGNLSCCVGQFWSVPLSLLILVIPVICLENIKVFIPGLFIGAGAYFAFMTYVTPAQGFIKPMIVELTYCLIGLIFGYITVTLAAKLPQPQPKAK